MFVIVERGAELFAQKFFFAAYADRGAKAVKCERADEGNPMAVDESRRDEHAQHSGVNRMPDKTIWSFANQFVIFEHARLQTPLLAENPHCCRAYPKRSDKKRDGDHEQQKFKPTTKSEDR